MADVNEAGRSLVLNLTLAWSLLTLCSEGLAISRGQAPVNAFWIVKSFVSVFLLWQAASHSRRALGGILGWHFRRRTASQAAALWTNLDKEGQNQTKEGSDIRENVASGLSQSSALQTDAGYRDWRGIVGFFHPFWFVLCLVHEAALTRPIAMLAVAERECCGRPCVPPRRLTPM